MYLHKKTYVGNKWKKPADQTKVNVSGVKSERVNSISEEVAYWRKANAIHKWFVENVQEGVDNCQEYYVEKEKLEELLETVTKVLEASKLVEGDVIAGYTFKDGKKEPDMEKGRVIEDPSVAEALLPTSSGFFFGGTEYDEYYIQDLEYTKETLETLLKEEQDGDFYYDSSW